MIDITVKNVSIGAKYQGKIYTLWIIGQLKGRKKIKIFDLFGYDLRDYINHKVKCAIQAALIQNINKNLDTKKTILKGTVVQNLSIPPNWIKEDNAVRIKNWIGVQNDDGIFFINNDDLLNHKLKKGDHIEFNVNRFDLLAWNPIE
ncbi:MAG: hypothetical protein ACXABO_14415 [Promethearchaeota archaeon]|jgi:hypothetical protein